MYARCPMTACRPMPNAHLQYQLSIAAPQDHDAISFWIVASVCVHTTTIINGVDPNGKWRKIVVARAMNLKQIKDSIVVENCFCYNERGEKGCIRKAHAKPGPNFHQCCWISRPRPVLANVTDTDVYYKNSPDFWLAYYHYNICLDFRKSKSFSTRGTIRVVPHL